MKGLLLKDFYMTIKYCRMTLVVSVLFLILAFFNDSLFILFYPGMICGLIPTTLLAYDERSRWLQYSMTMPYTKTQIVSSKYLIGLTGQILMLLVIAAVQAVKMRMSGSFMLREYLITLMLIAILSLFSSSVSLPFIFKLGVEKGRITYYVMVGVVCGLGGGASVVLGKEIPQHMALDSVLPVLLLIVAGIYALSWYLSVVFFKKREI
ncbi:MAG: ABC-2 transporter permease [Clostridia bacterium]|nr:ABC-2 transporter permease [Clostridia bacterium]MBQ2255397.1 ABC-2 transporter permease [Clostridia bacterium]MBQ5794236.1 ABC-2 transporter permease [Clostridia bacterium]